MSGKVNTFQLMSDDQNQKNQIDKYILRIEKNVPLDFRQATNLLLKTIFH